MMKPSILLIAAHLFILAGCTRSHDADSSHAHDEHGNHISSQEETLEPLVYTLYSDKTELFVEFKPLVAGQESRFAAHFAKTGDLFTAVDSGSVTPFAGGPGWTGTVHYSRAARSAWHLPSADDPRKERRIQPGVRHPYTRIHRSDHHRKSGRFS
ncbi:MAG: hypothetical protein IPJ06_02050 [Saprospiraceae bacterium]|nr:hypothetical protein [Saprospiraceae bacterium]